MSILLASEVVARVRDKAVDTDTVDPAATSADILRELNRQYIPYYIGVEPRYAQMSQTTSGLTYGNGAYAVNTTPTNIARIQRVMFKPSATATEGAPVERAPGGPLDIFTFYAADQAVSGTPRYWAAERVPSAATASIGIWRVLIWPPSDGTVKLQLRCQQFPALLTTTPDTTPDVTEAGVYILADLAAAEIARRIGEDQQFIQGILSGIPDDVQRAMSVSRSATLVPNQAFEQPAP